MPDTPRDDSHSPDRPYDGPERRQREPSVKLEQHIVPLPPGYKDMSVWQKAWANFGALGIGALAFISFMLFFQNMYKDEIQDRRARDAEDREIRRAEVAQQDRRAEQMAGELRMMRISFEAVATRIEIGTTRMEAAKTKMEAILKDLEMLVKKIMEVAGKPTSAIVPMLFAFNKLISPQRVEVAPMPRTVHATDSSQRE